MTDVYECACVASYVPYVIALARVVSNVRSLACMHARGNGGKYQKNQARERKELYRRTTSRERCLPYFFFLRIFLSPSVCCGGVCSDLALNSEKVSLPFSSNRGSHITRVSSLVHAPRAHARVRQPNPTFRSFASVMSTPRPTSTAFPR